MMNSALSYARQNSDRFLTELREVLRNPIHLHRSGRTMPICSRAAEWMAEQLRGPSAWTMCRSCRRLAIPWSTESGWGRGASRRP